MEDSEQVRNCNYIYRISSQGKLHIKRWENDGLVFIEGPSDTHLINLTTVHLLEYLALNPNSKQNNIKDYLRTKLNLDFNEVDFQRMLLTLLNINLLEYSK